MTGCGVSAAQFLVGVAELMAALVAATWLVIHVIGPAAIYLYDLARSLRRLPGSSER
jgi:hypothetical protein